MSNNEYKYDSDCESESEFVPCWTPGVPQKYIDEMPSMVDVQAHAYFERIRPNSSSLSGTVFSCLVESRILFLFEDGVIDAMEDLTDAVKMSLQEYREMSMNHRNLPKL